VKDLIRYLRHEDETRDVRQQLGAAQILQNDLLPILTQHRQDKPLFDAVIRFHSSAFLFLPCVSIHV
jgi:timeless